MQVLLDQNYFSSNYEKDKMHPFHLIFDVLICCTGDSCITRKETNKTNKKPTADKYKECTARKTFFSNLHLLKKKN